MNSEDREDAMEAINAFVQDAFAQHDGEIVNRIMRIASKRDITLNEYIYWLHEIAIGKDEIHNKRVMDKLNFTFNNWR